MSELQRIDQINNQAEEKRIGNDDIERVDIDQKGTINKQKGQKSGKKKHNRICSKFNSTTFPAINVETGKGILTMKGQSCEYRYTQSNNHNGTTFEGSNESNKKIAELDREYLMRNFPVSYFQNVDLLFKIIGKKKKFIKNTYKTDQKAKSKQNELSLQHFQNKKHSTQPTPSDQKSLNKSKLIKIPLLRNETTKQEPRIDECNKILTHKYKQIMTITQHHNQKQQKRQMQKVFSQRKLMKPDEKELNYVGQIREITDNRNTLHSNAKSSEKFRIKQKDSCPKISSEDEYIKQITAKDGNFHSSKDRLIPTLKRNTKLNSQNQFLVSQKRKENELKSKPNFFLQQKKLDQIQLSLIDNDHHVMPNRMSEEVSQSIYPQNRTLNSEHTSTYQKNHIFLNENEKEDVYDEDDKKTIKIGQDHESEMEVKQSQEKAIFIKAKNNHIQAPKRVEMRPQRMNKKSIEQKKVEDRSKSFEKNHKARQNPQVPLQKHKNEESNKVNEEVKEVKRGQQYNNKFQGIKKKKTQNNKTQNNSGQTMQTRQGNHKIKQQETPIKQNKNKKEANQSHESSNKFQTIDKNKKSNQVFSINKKQGQKKLNNQKNQRPQSHQKSVENDESKVTIDPKNKNKLRIQPKTNKNQFKHEQNKSKQEESKSKSPSKSMVPTNGKINKIDIKTGSKNKQIQKERKTTAPNTQNIPKTVIVPQNQVDNNLQLHNSSNSNKQPTKASNQIEENPSSQAPVINKKESKVQIIIPMDRPLSISKVPSTKKILTQQQSREINNEQTITAKQLPLNSKQNDSQSFAENIISSEGLSEQEDQDLIKTPHFNFKNESFGKNAKKRSTKCFDNLLKNEEATIIQPYQQTSVEQTSPVIQHRNSSKGQVNKLLSTFSPCLEEKENAIKINPKILKRQHSLIQKQEKANSNIDQEEINNFYDEIIELGVDQVEEYRPKLGRLSNFDQSKLEQFKEFQKKLAMETHVQPDSLNKQQNKGESLHSIDKAVMVYTESDSMINSCDQNLVVHHLSKKASSNLSIFSSNSEPQKAQVNQKSKKKQTIIFEQEEEHQLYQTKQMNLNQSLICIDINQKVDLRPAQVQNETITADALYDPVKNQSNDQNYSISINKIEEKSSIIQPASTGPHERITQTSACIKIPLDAKNSRQSSVVGTQSDVSLLNLNDDEEQAINKHLETLNNVMKETEQIEEKSSDSEQSSISLSKNINKKENIVKASNQQEHISINNQGIDQLSHNIKTDKSFEECETLKNGGSELVINNKTQISEKKDENLKGSQSMKRLSLLFDQNMTKLDTKKSFNSNCSNVKKSLPVLQKNEKRSSQVNEISQQMSKTEKSPQNNLSSEIKPKWIEEADAKSLQFESSQPLLQKEQSNKIKQQINSASSRQLQKSISKKLLAHQSNHQYVNNENTNKKSQGKDEKRNEKINHQMNVSAQQMHNQFETVKSTELDLNNEQDSHKSRQIAKTYVNNNEQGAISKQTQVKEQKSLSNSQKMHKSHQKHTQLASDNKQSSNQPSKTEQSNLISQIQPMSERDLSKEEKNEIKSSRNNIKMHKMYEINIINQFSTSKNSQASQFYRPPQQKLVKSNKKSLSKRIQKEESDNEIQQQEKKTFTANIPQQNEFSDRLQARPLNKQDLELQNKIQSPLSEEKLVQKSMKVSQKKVINQSTNRQQDVQHIQQVSIPQRKNLQDIPTEQPSIKRVETIQSKPSKLIAQEQKQFKNDQTQDQKLLPKVQSPQALVKPNLQENNCDQEAIQKDIVSSDNSSSSNNIISPIEENQMKKSVKLLNNTQNNAAISENNANKLIQNSSQQNIHAEHTQKCKNCKKSKLQPNIKKNEQKLLVSQINSYEKEVLQPDLPKQMPIGQEQFVQLPQGNSKFLKKQTKINTSNLPEPEQQLNKEAQTYQIKRQHFCKLQEEYIYSDQSQKSDHHSSSNIEAIPLQPNSLSQRSNNVLGSQRSSIQKVKLLLENATNINIQSQIGNTKDISTNTFDLLANFEQHTDKKMKSQKNLAKISKYISNYNEQEIIPLSKYNKFELNEQIWQMILKIFTFLNSNHVYLDRLIDSQSVWLLKCLQKQPKFQRFALPLAQNTDKQLQIRECLRRQLAVLSQRVEIDQKNIKFFIETLTGMPVLLLKETCYHKLDNLYRHNNIFGFTYGKGEVWRIVGTLQSKKTPQEKRLRLEKISNKEIIEITWKKFLDEFKYSFIAGFSENYYLKSLKITSKAHQKTDNPSFKLIIKESSNQSNKVHCLMGITSHKDLAKEINGKMLVYGKTQSEKKGEEYYKYLGSGDIGLVSMKLKKGEYIIVLQIEQKSGNLDLQLLMGSESKQIYLEYDKV